MEANDLMMKIQVLVDSGKSTAELDRLNKKLADLTDELKNLEKAKITPLNDDLAEIKRTSQALKNINLGNYVKNLEKVGEAFQRLNVDTKNIDRLRDAFKNLEAENATKSVANLETQLRNAKLQLEGIAASARNGILFVDPRNTFDLNQAQRSLKDIGADIIMNNGLIRDERSEIIRLKNELRNVGTVYQKELLGAGRLDLSGLSRQLKEQKSDLTLGQQAVKDYTGDLKFMRKELSNLRKVGKEISGAKLADTAKAIFTTDIAKLTKSLEEQNSLLKIYKQNLKAIQDSNMRFRINSAESLFGERYIRSISTVKSDILSLKDAIKSASAIKFDAGITASINRVDEGLKSINEEKSFKSLSDFNAELRKQQQELLKTNRSIKTYSDILAKLKIEAQQKSVPDFTMGGGVNLLQDLRNVEQKLRNIRTNELIPTQNELRNLQSARALDKAKFIDDLKAVNKLYQAEINVEKLKDKKERSQSYIDSRVETIANNELEIARRNLDIVRSYGLREASLKKQQNDIKNSINLLSNEEKTIKSLVTAERQRAKEAAQSVKTRAGGILEITKEKINLQSLSNLYRSNVDSLKNYFGILKQGAQESAAALMLQLPTLNDELKLARQLESNQKDAIQKQQKTIAQTDQLIAKEKERYDNFARLGKLQNQYDQKVLQDRIRAREADLEASKSGVEAIRQKVGATKEEMASIKEVIREREGEIRSSIASAQQRISSGQLTSAQLKEERAAIRSNIAEQKDLSKSYQEGLKYNVRSLEVALQGANARISAIKNQIKELKLLNTEEARNNALSLAQELTTAKKEKVDIKGQISDTEKLAKAEMTLIAELEKSARSVTSIGRLFGKSGGIIREFGDAIFFAFGPQMAGFIAAAGIANAVREVTVAFFEANKSVENLLRGLNAISGGQGVVLFDQLVDSANRLGIPLKQVSQSFLEVQAATTGTNFEGQKTKELFDALANALTVTGADAVQFNRGFRAMGQILSKDQLYAEELRQQLSEALPGAVQVFARALDVSPKQLLRFIEAGAIEGDNLRRTLALVTKELEKTYKVANEQDFTFTQKAALAQNALNLLFVELGNTGIWRAFGNSLLLARDTFVELKDITSEYSVYVKAIFATLSQIVDETSSDIKRASDNISENISLSNVEFSPAGLIRNFKNFFALLGPEARDALKPVEDAIANIDFSRITVALTATVRAAIESIGILIVSAIDSLNQLGPLADVIGQSFVTLGARIKSIYVEVSNFISLKIEELSAEFTKSKFNVRWTQLFGSAEELNALFKEIEGLDQRYKEAAKSADERSRKSQENYNQEKSKLESLNNILQSQGAIWARTTQSAFEGIGQRLLNAFNKLETNQSFFNTLKKAQKDANALQQIYDIDLNYQATLKEKSLQISKEQAKLDKELLKIQNDYNDAIMEVTANKYKRWAEQGQITQEGADFLIQSAKGESARKAWNQAQDAVDSYNAAVKEGSGVSKDTIDILKQQASELLSIAANRAKEIGDEYKLKQVYDSQKSLLEEQKKQIGGIDNVLKNAEGANVKTDLKPIEDKTVSSLVNGVQEQINNLPQPMITVGVQLENNGITQSLDLNPTESRARGGLIPGGYSNRDSVHALLAPGEFVIPSNIVKALSPSFFYDLIRSRGLKIPQVNARENITIPHFAAGGLVQQSAQPIIINAAGKQIHLSGSREAANQLAKLLTQTGRAL